MASPTLPDSDNKIRGRGGDGEWLQTLYSLQRLRVAFCPKFLSEYKTSVSSSRYPFPSSLQHLTLSGMQTFEPVSNLTSLAQLYISDCGEDLRWEGLWPLHTQGQLSDLTVYGSPNFFVGSDPVRGLQDEQEQQRLLRSSKLQELTTDDVAGVLVAPVCSLLSSSLTKLIFEGNKEVERFTKEQEEALHLLTSLQELQFLNCDKLQCLPAGLNKLTNLKRLKISDCPALRLLPKDGLPSSLQELDVKGCKNEELIQRCRRLMGTIPKIRLQYGD